MTITLDHPSSPSDSAISPGRLRSVALDITRACPARCVQCYNDSGPDGTHGAMAREDWLSALAQAVELGAERVQFIGGDPVLHPDLPELVNRALDLHAEVEVFTSLIHIRPGLWPVLRQRGVSLATTYQSDRPEEHNAITRNRGAHQRTRANLQLALGYGIPVRAALQRVLEGQRTEQAAAELRALGVHEVRVDRMRAIGRAADDRADAVGELCGHCGRGRAAILPTGDVAVCVMSGGMMSAGNIRTTPLAEIVGNEAWRAFTATLPRPRAGCVPDTCTPNEDSCQPSPGALPDGVRTADGCNPGQDGEDCSPAETEACDPAY
jgi:MoaA/NifB/PqqE/SkfB family radical SAM enzyme